MRHLVTATVATPALLLALAVPAIAQPYVPRTVHDVDLLDNGNLLVTDGGTFANPTSSGVYEMDRGGQIAWAQEGGLNWAHNADRQADGSVIISDTGNDRVIIVAANGSVLWSTADISLSDGSSLNYPNDANLLPSGNRLITDRDNHRVIEIDAAGNILWQFGQTGLPGGGPLRLAGPHNADRLPDGHTIIADTNNNRIVEVDAAGTIVWVFATGLNWPRDADRLPNGNTLINDSNNRRIIEVTPAGAVVWTYALDDLSYDADRLATGNTLISVQDRIIEVDSGGTVVWSYPATLDTEIIEGYLVTAPNGNDLWVKIIQPRADLFPGERFPAVVNVPGGLGAGESGNLQIADDGFVELHFNAEGRGLLHPSEGTEDYNGFVHQDDLKAVIEFAHALPNVLDDNVGVVTGSYGITMGACCLGRHPELEVKYLVDQEGPSESYVTVFEPWALDADPSNDRHEQGFAVFGHYSTYRDPSPENVAFWSQREATRYIGGMRCRYVRMQAQWDHAQPPNQQWPGFDYPPLWYPGKHGVDLVNLATLGDSPWTRVNAASLGNAPNATYGHDDSPVFYSGRMADHPDELRTVLLEMVAMPPLSTPPTPPVPLGGALILGLVLVSAGAWASCVRRIGERSQNV